MTSAVNPIHVDRTNFNIINSEITALQAQPFSSAGALTGSATVDVASLVDGAGASQSVTVTGAALGDFALASHGVSTAGITVTANVTAANTVIVRFQNESGGTLDLASTTLRVVVIPRAAFGFA